MTDLVELAKKGDKPAFDEVILQCVPDLFKIAMSVLRNRDDADDAVCETVAKAYKNIHKLNDCSSFKTWIVRILINQTKDEYKRRRRVVFLEDIPCEPQYEDAYNLGNDELSSAVAELRPELRAVVALHYFKDMRIKEIASVLQVPQGTVKWRLSRARSILKEKMSEAPSPKRREGIEHA